MTARHAPPDVYSCLGGFVFDEGGYEGGYEGGSFGDDAGLGRERLSPWHLQ